MAVSPVEIEQTKEQLQLNENNLSTAAQYLNNTNFQAPTISADQQIPYSSPSTSISYFPPQINTIQNSSVPAFQLMNSQYSPQQLGTTSEKSFVSMPQESTTISTIQEPVVTSMCPPQSEMTQESTYQTLTTFPAQINYSEHHPANVGSTTTIMDVQNSKEISNYFTQFQTQASPSNNSSTIPMFSVKNFPQVSPLAQPLGK